MSGTFEACIKDEQNAGAQLAASFADNATGKGSAIARGAARQGELILAGLLDAAIAGERRM